jgi:hypothetical protein
MPVDWDLHYDRRVSEEFLAHFLEGGGFYSLVEYARFAPFAVDLQMRHSPKTFADHATVYVGLTSVLDVHRKRGASGAEDQYLLKGHKWAADGGYGFNTAWTRPASVQDLKVQWRSVEDYLEAIFPAAYVEHASREGAVQSAASVFASHERIMFDREVAVHFKDKQTKLGIFREETADLVKAVQNIPGVPGRPPASFGGECDLFALDSAGRLLAVEVKPRAAGTIVWSGIQATVYARLLQRWLNTPPKGTDSPATVLRGMLDQRARLGLAPARRPGLPDVPIGAGRCPAARLEPDVCRSHAQSSRDRVVSGAWEPGAGGLRSQHGRPDGSTALAVRLVGTLQPGVVTAGIAVAEHILARRHGRIEE